MRPGARAARRPPAPPPVTLADVTGGRRAALMAVDAVAAAVILVLTVTGWQPPTQRDLLGTAVLAVAACVSTRAVVPWVTGRDRDGSSLGTVVDLSSLVLLLSALLSPTALIPLVCLPSFAVDYFWARRPLFAVVLNAVALTALTQVAGVVRETVARGDVSQARWALAAWGAAALWTVGAYLWAVLGRWIVRGAVPEWSNLGDTVPFFQEAAMAATTVLGATLWRLDPVLVIYMIVPVAILQRLLYFREVQVAARSDDKTGLWNCRFFEECAQRELGRARRTGSPLALLVLDMDLLRVINNTYGHQNGDRALIHVAQVLSRRARRYDLVCRFGGEEFLVLLPGTPLDAAVDVAERLREEIRSTPLILGDHAVTVSVSIGVAQLEPRDGDLEQLLAAADARVYAAKNAGRDRVVGGPLPV
ncbi:MAG: GGDEF domain-containing protein [Kineosporiaceae bacterium]